ncbi:unnamed protein product [Toxocara canis]|uniref:Transmembrane protein n=1 Tax=Toxocara canis TaxID=6265 RepID=A0A183V644_TOXCA|nr:unnamed protein product [Toxocara canis]
MHHASVAHGEHGPSVLGCFSFVGLLMETSTKVGAGGMGRRDASHVKVTTRLCSDSGWWRFCGSSGAVVSGANANLWVPAMKRFFPVRFNGFAFGVFKTELFSDMQRTEVVLYTVPMMLAYYCRQAAGIAVRSHCSKRRLKQDKLPAITTSHGKEFEIGTTRKAKELRTSVRLVVFLSIWRG